MRPESRSSIAVFSCECLGALSATTPGILRYAPLNSSGAGQYRSVTRSVDS